MTIDRIPPHNIDAEKAVLGSMMIDSTAVNISLEILKENNFYYDSHKIIFRDIEKLFNLGTPIDILIVMEELSKIKEIERVGGKEYLTTLLNSISTSAHVEYYANIVKEKSILRNLINSSTEIINDCYSSEEDATRVLDKTEKKIFD